MSSDILKISDLSVRFATDNNTVFAVNGISYSIKEGEIVGIVGESGSGKSVSMLAVMGLLNQGTATVNGSVVFQGTSLLDLSRSEIKKFRGNQIAMIFQDPMASLNPVLTIGSQITESISAHMNLSRQETNDLAVKLLGMVGIPGARDRLKSYPHQFSGGQRQRIMIASAIACNPALLIADEPTTALDVTVQAQITELMKSLHDQIGMSLIWITHDLGVIAGLVDRVLVMYAGFIVEDAPVDDFYDRPLHPYAEGLLKSVPRMDAEVAEKLDSIEGLPPNLTEMPTECVFLKRCPYVQEICHQQMPPIYESAPQHMAACWIDISNNTVREDMVSQFRQ